MDSHFLQLVGTAMGTKAVPPYANLFMGPHEETIWETFIWAIPPREEIHRRYLPDLSRHYRTAPVHERLHEQPPSHNQIHLRILHPRDILSRHEDPHKNRPQTLHNPIQKTH